MSYGTRAGLAALLILLISSTSQALIMVGKGNEPVHDAGWPAGAVDVANLKTRVGWYEGPPLGGGEWTFLYRGDAGDLNQALKTFSAIRAPALQVFIHDGPQNCTFLKDDKDPKADTHYDWSFGVWVPASWHHLYNDPRTTFLSDSENFRKPVAAPRIDIYVTERIDWKKVTIPEGVQVADERAAAGQKPAGDSATIRGDVFDMASGKPIYGAEIRVDVRKGNQNVWEKTAAGTSNKTGRFEIAKIPLGSYRIVATAIGYAPRLIGYHELREGTSQKLVIELSAAAKLSGTFTDADGKPVPNIPVRTRNNMGIDGRGYSLPDPVEVKTDEKGQVTLTDLPTGYGQVWAYAKGWYHLDSLKLHAIPAEKPLALQMVATGVIKGKVLDAKGKPASGGNVNVEPPGGSTIGSWGGGMNVKPDGTFEFENVPPGPYILSTQSQYPGAPADPNAVKVTVTSGKTVEVSLKK
jgi:hypothetical protein